MEDDPHIDTYRFEGLDGGAPCFDGHFPGSPIMPGAVLLGYAARALRESGRPLSGVSRMKFLRPLGPGTPFEIEVAATGKAATIRWLSEGEVLAHAKVSLR